MDRPDQPFDQAMRDLFHDAPFDLARVVLGVDIGAHARLDPTHLFTRRLDADGLIIEDRTNRYVHVEFQSARKANLGWRMARYWMALMERDGGESPTATVESHLVLLSPRADTSGLGYCRVGSLSFRYSVHRLWNMDPEALLAVPRLAPLAPLAAADSDEDRYRLLVRALKLVDTLPPDEAELATTRTGLLGSLWFGNAVIDATLRRLSMPIDINELPYIVEVRAEGRDEGVAEGQARSLRHLIERRHNDPALAALVDSLPVGLLEEAFDKAIDSDRDTFRAWVESHGAE